VYVLWQRVRNETMLRSLTHELDFVDISVVANDRVLTVARQIR